MTLTIKKALETLEVLLLEYALESQAARDQMGRKRQQEPPIFRLLETDPKGPNSEARLGSDIGVLRFRESSEKCPIPTDLTC